MTAAATMRRPTMNEEERRRRDAYARVRASFRLEGQELTPEEERDLEPYFRGELTLEEITQRAIARFTVRSDRGPGASDT